MASRKKEGVNTYANYNSPISTFLAQVAAVKAVTPIANLERSIYD